LPLHPKAKPGRLAQWMIGQGLTMEILDLLPPEEVWT